MRAWGGAVLCGGAVSIGVALGQSSHAADAVRIDAGSLDVPPTDAASSDAADADAAMADAGFNGAVAETASRDAATDPVVPRSFFDVHPYVGSSIHISLDTVGIVNVSLGASFRYFPSNGRAPIELRLGLTAYAGHDLFLTAYKRVGEGYGAEAEGVLPAADVGFGLRVSAQTEQMRSYCSNEDPFSLLLTAGLRFYMTRHTFLAADIYHVTSADPSAYEPHTTTGALFGVGITSRGVSIGNAAYAPTELRAVSATPPPQNEQAWRLARQRAWDALDKATAAALRGDCETVGRIGSDVHMFDPEFYAKHFVVDDSIAKCITAPTP